MKVFLILACVAAAASSMALDADQTHDHPYVCGAAGIFTDPVDHCEGFHVCNYNYSTKELEHVRYVECRAGTLFNGRFCMSSSKYTCPY